MWESRFGTRAASHSALLTGRSQSFAVVGTRAPALSFGVASFTFVTISGVPEWPMGAASLQR